MSCARIYVWLSQRYHIRCQKSIDRLPASFVLISYVLRRANVSFRRGRVTDFKEIREHLIILYATTHGQRTYTCQCHTDSNIILGRCLYDQLWQWFTIVVAFHPWLAWIQCKGDKSTVFFVYNILLDESDTNPKRLITTEL